MTINSNLVRNTKFLKTMYIVEKLNFLAFILKNFLYNL